MIDPDNTDQALTAGGVKSRKVIADQPQEAARKGCGGGRSGIIRSNRAGCRAARVKVNTTERA